MEFLLIIFGLCICKNPFCPPCGFIERTELTGYPFLADLVRKEISTGLMFVSPHLFPRCRAGLGIQMRSCNNIKVKWGKKSSGMLRDHSQKAMTLTMTQPPFTNSYFSTFLERRKGLIDP